MNRAWDWTLGGGYVQDDWAARARSHDQRRPAPRGRDACRSIRATSTCRICWRRRRPIGPLYQNPGATFSPRIGAAWSVGGSDRTSVRGGYGLYYTLNNQQDLIVTVTNPPATPRVVIGSPSFPVPPFERAGGISVRPIQDDIEYPRTQMWNVNVQRLLGDGWVASIGYAGARGRHLWRNADVNVPAPAILRRRDAVLRRGARPPEPGVLRHRAEGQRRRLLVQGPDPRGAAAVDARAAGADVVHVVEGRGHDAERHVLLGLDDRLGVGDAGGDPRLQQGAVGLPRRAQLGAERDLADPGAARSGERRRRAAERLADRDDRADAQRQSADRVRPDQPVALAVGAVARAGHRPRPPQLRAGTRTRRRRHRRSGPLVRSDGVRAAADRHVRQRRPQRA